MDHRSGGGAEDQRPGSSKDKQPQKLREKEIRVVVDRDDLNKDESPAHRSVFINYEELQPLPYRGGYIDTRHGTKYLNAAQQTDGKPKDVVTVEKFTKETQKCLVRDQAWNTIREAFTQMGRRNLVLDFSRDFSRITGRYVDSNEWEKSRIKAAIYIQKKVRRWIAERKAQRIREYIKSRNEFHQEQEKLQRQAAEEAVRREIDRRMCPRTLADFSILYEELETWRLQELEKVNACNYNYNDRLNALKEVLTKELKLLVAIDKLRAIAAKSNRKDRIQRTMLKMCAPKIWELTNGRIVHVRTPATARASDLMHLYNALEKQSLTVDERMGVLGYVKWTVQEFDNPLTREILLLIDREADLMYRNRPPKSLVGLRQRILALFLQFIENPEFNPEAAGHQYVHNDFDFKQKQSMLRRDTHLELAR